MFSTEHQKLSRPLEKRLATPRLKTTDLKRKNIRFVAAAAMH